MNYWLHKPMKPLGPLALATISITTGLAVLAGCLGDYTDLIGGGGAGDFLATGRTLSTFTAIQVDPRSEDSAGPQFVVADDLNGDGLMDLISAWNETQPVQIHLQGRTSSGGMSFETVTLAGNIPVVSVAGLAVEDFDQDGRLDIAVLIKETLLTNATCLGLGSPSACSPGDPDRGICTNDEECSIFRQDCDDGSRCRPPPVSNGVIIVYLGPEDPTQVNQALLWRDQDIKSSNLAGAGSALGPPEEGGFTSMAIGDIDADNDPDIIVAWNPSEQCNDPPEVLVFSNDSPGSVQRGDWTVRPIDDPFQCSPFVACSNCVPIKDVALGDIDRDGDLDIVVTFPQAGSMNVRWYRNPLNVAVDAEGICYRHDGSWNVGTVGQVEPRDGFTRIGDADIVRLGDVDRDGILDVVMRSTGGRVLQWLKGPDCPITPTAPGRTDPFRNIPWQVYTLAEYAERTPEALAIGDLNFDGQLDVIAAAGGAVAWFDSQAAASVFDHWGEHLIIDDVVSGASIGATDPGVDEEESPATTFINSIVVVDLDGDGANDLVATLDRSGLSGLTNDALAWFRNTNP